jgi:cytosine permease
MAIPSTAATASSAATDQQDVHEEFHSKPVPLRSRLGFKDPALVWSGFGIAYICAVIGGLIQQGLGTGDAILAILLGNFILFLYSAAIGYANGKWGLNFPLTVKAVFGESGAVLPILIMAVLVTGWYAFQAWLTADILRVALVSSGLAIGISQRSSLSWGYAIFGINGCEPHEARASAHDRVRRISLCKVIPAGSSFFSGAGTGKISFMTGVGMAWSTFVVSGTMTGDIVRYTKTGKQAVWVTAVAFLFSNAPFMVMGALISAAINDPGVTYFLQPGLGLGLVALVGIAILSNWSTCDACLYNATMGYSNAIPGLNWRNAAIVGTIIGVIAAGTGLIGNIVNWLILLGLIVPPIGGAIIADYYVVRGERGFGVVRHVKFNWAAIIAVVAGILVGYYVNQTYPSFLFGAAGIAASFIVYAILGKAAAAPLGAELSNTPSGAEAGGEHD